jgi:glycoprotein-N-acetylgalactosamine 3-beta-galactosyltransferase
MLLAQYDYFHIGGDDLYLIVENLRLYLESEEIKLASNGGHYLPNGSEDTQTPLFLGRRFAEGGNRDTMFISGGSGYTMNKGKCCGLLNISATYCLFTSLSLSCLSE